MSQQILNKIFNFCISLVRANVGLIHEKGGQKSHWTVPLKSNNG